MRTIEEFRDRQLQALAGALLRPGMYGGNAGGTESFLERVIRDLCWIDEREADWHDVVSKYLEGASRVCGQLQGQLLPFPDYAGEVASTYAEVAFVLGYFTPARLLSHDEMRRLRSRIRRPFTERDWNANELYAELGPPSHEVRGNTTVACYACSSRDVKWVFFDLHRPAPEQNRLDIPRVRDIRKSLRNRLHLLPFGRQLAQSAQPSRRSDRT